MLYRKEECLWGTADGESSPTSLVPTAPLPPQPSEPNCQPNFWWVHMDTEHSIRYYKDFSRWHSVDDSRWLVKASRHPLWEDVLTLTSQTLYYQVKLIVKQTEYNQHYSWVNNKSFVPFTWIIAPGFHLVSLTTISPFQTI